MNRWYMWAGAEVVLSLFVNTFGIVALSFDVWENGVGWVGSGFLGPCQRASVRGGIGEASVSHGVVDGW
jgi:hypothetical protein